MRTILSILFLAVSTVSAFAQARLVNTTASRPVTEAPTISLFRANAVTFRVKLDSTRPTLTGVTKLTAEIRASKLDTDAPLAATDVDSPTGAGPFDIEMTAGQMNQSLAGAASKTFWLVIYTIAPGDVLDVLYTAPLKLTEHGASLTAPAPPNTAIALTEAAADALYATLADAAALDARITDLEAGTGTDTVLGDSFGGSLSDSMDLEVSDGTPTGAVDLTPYALTVDVAAGYQPLDSDLTALAALTSTTFGRGLITTADASALRTTAGLGTLATQSGTFSGTSSGTNTGDETLATIKTKLGISTLSGSNTGDQDLSAYLTSATAATTYVPVTRTINGSALSSNVTITTITGNAGTATALATPRAINGTNFDGTAAITVTAAAGTLTGTTLNGTVTASSLTSFGPSIALGTPASGVATNLTGTAAGLTAGNVTTNANLTGHITSAGNAAVLGSFTLAQLSTAVSDANIARSDAAQTFTGMQTISGNPAGQQSLTADKLIFAGEGYRVGSGGKIYFSDGTDYGQEFYLTSDAFLFNRGIIISPAASATPASNGQMVFEATSNTSLTIKLKGTDGTVRSVVLTLAP